MNRTSMTWTDIYFKGLIFVIILVICFTLATVETNAADDRYPAKAEGSKNHIEYDKNDGTVHTVDEGLFKVGDETVYCMDIHKSFEAGNKTRTDASTSMNSDQIENIALSLEYIEQYTASHTELSSKKYWLGQCMIWRILSEQYDWDCHDVRVPYDEISRNVQDEMYSGARTFVKANKGKYKCGGYIYTGGGQALGQFWANKRKEVILHTTATDEKTGGKNIVSGKNLTIVDKVELDGLEVGTKYRLSGWQMIKEENAELLINGKKVSGDHEFTADKEKMTVEIAFTFDGSALGGKSVVSFEELYDISNPKESVKVAEHKDINDSGQTVRIEERVIKIHTIATDKNGRKEMAAGKNLTIVDKVELDGLEVGTKYRLSGWQMIKEENAELLINGKKVSGDHEFTADKEKMTVEIAFTFDGSALGGKTLVTFEELYDVTSPDQPKKMAEHKNIKDEGQTVAITKKVQTASTGDDSNILLFACLSIMAASAIVMTVMFRRRSR